MPNITTNTLPEVLVKFLDNHSDVEDGGVDGPRPNQAMRLQTMYAEEGITLDFLEDFEEYVEQCEKRTSYPDVRVALRRLLIRFELELAGHPTQPVFYDELGVLRFKPNAIINYLFDTGRLSLNSLATIPFPAEDRAQIAQMLGYSVSGYRDLSYVSETPSLLADADAILDEYRKYPANAH